MNLNKMAFDFTGKKGLVTGAGRGIGRGIAVAMAKAGCKVYALDCNEESLDTLVAEQPNVVKLVQDLSEWDETRSTLEKLEPLDFLVNNAGVHLGFRTALNHTKEELDKYLDINLLAGINCMQVIGKKMVDAGKGGAIVNMSSQVSTRAYPNSLGYCVSKAGVDMVTKQFALELGPHNIRVNSVNPTVVRTELIKSLDGTKHLEEVLIERTPNGKVNEVENVVGPVMYLLSDYAAMVTGTLNMVDGGISCNITIKQ